MKVKGNGRAKVLSQAELDRLFERGLTTPRDKLLFAIAYYCACRVSEVLVCRVQSGLHLFLNSGRLFVLLNKDFV